MKKLIIIALLLSACATSDPTPTVAKYTSVAGKWKFSTQHASGSFEIAPFRTYLIETTIYGDVNIDGKDYLVDHEIAMDDSLSAKVIKTIWIQNKATGNQVVLDNVTVNSEFNKLTAGDYYYSDGTKFYYPTGQLIITRE